MKKSNRLLYFLALLKIIIPYLLQNPVYEPHRDEFLYLAEGRHLAWGFMEVPPMLSVFAWLIHILGDGMFWVKLVPSLFGAATFIVAGKIVQSLGGKNFALILLFLPFIFGAYLRLFFLFQPNPPEVFFWTMIAYSFICFTQTKENKWLYVFGVSVGLGMLSKYSVAFYTTSILLGLLCTEHRTVFMNKHFWYASLTGFIIFIPNLIWQYQNHFPVIVHMNELQQTQLQYINPWSFLIDQLLMNIACLFIWFRGLLFTIINKQYRFIGLAYVFVIILLLLGHGKNYYALGVYPTLFAFGATALEKVTMSKERFLRYVFIIVPVVVGTYFIPILLPILPPKPLADLYASTYMVKTGFLKWEDHKDHPLPQDFSDMLGWEEMAQKVAKAYSMLSDSEKKDAVIFCNNYGMAGAVSYYAPKYHLPQAYSDNASFLYWMPANMRMKNFVLVSDDPDEKKHDFAKGFKSVTKIDSITTAYARERGDYIYLFIGADENFEKFFKDKIAKDKAEFKY
jgi:hypothetical protein